MGSSAPPGAGCRMLNHRHASSWLVWLTVLAIAVGIAWGSGFRRRFVICGRRGLAMGLISASRDQDLCSVSQAVDAIDDNPFSGRKSSSCLLYTSDAADEED